MRSGAENLRETSSFLSMRDETKSLRDEGIASARWFAPRNVNPLASDRGANVLGEK